MFWKRRRTPTWFLDPSKVSYGAVVQGSVRNLSRSHVRVRYGRTCEVQFVPLTMFMRRCQEATQRRRSLDIEHLLVAPILKRRHAEFFDRLTDWGPAAGRARAGAGQHTFSPVKAVCSRAAAAPGKEAAAATEKIDLSPFTSGRAVCVPPGARGRAGTDN